MQACLFLCGEILKYVRINKKNATSLIFFCIFDDNGYLCPRLLIRLI